MKKTVGGACLVALSLFMLLGFFTADLEAGLMANSLAFLVAVVLPMAGGLYLFYLHHRELRRLQAGKSGLAQATLEAEILKLAGRKGGKLAVVEVVAEFAVDNGRAKEALDSLAGQGTAEIELTESGVIVYSFYDIQHLKDKGASKGVLDA